MRFWKMHGAGNDFVILNSLDGGLSGESLPALARRLCARRTGVGADGLMVVVPAKGGGDFGMLFYNADGSRGEMCGNGARCLCRYGYENGLAGEGQRIETTAGLVTGERIDRTRYRIRLNDPAVLDRREVRVGEQSWLCRYTELGNPGIPHAVVLLDDWDSRERGKLRALGRELRFAAAFPKGANVSFVRLLSPELLLAIPYERGVEDFTLACGTGCGAIAATLAVEGLIGERVTIRMPGGELSVSLTREGESVRDLLLTGPTCLVCTGEVPEEFFH